MNPLSKFGWAALAAAHLLLYNPLPVAAQTPEIVVFFSPNGGGERAIVGALSEARETVYLAMYSLTSVPIAQAIVAARKRGVKIYIKVDEQQSSGKSMTAVITYLRANGVPVYVSHLSRTMHHKYAVIDGTTLILGSYNWTRNGEYVNKENLIIWRSPGMAKLFLDEFGRIE